MSDKKTPTFAKKTAAAALSSLLALGLSACNTKDHDQYVKCYGVSKLGPDHWIATTPGQCNKLANSHIEPLSATEAQQVTKYTPEDYIKCYGVAAAGENGCATKTSACGGTVKTPSSKDAWVPMPKGICEQVKGAVVGLAHPKKI